MYYTISNNKPPHKPRGGTEKTMSATVILGVSDNEGYSPDQVNTDVTLHDLLIAVEAAIEAHGEDATVVLSNGQRYGAGFGRICSYHGEVEFEEVDGNGEEDEF